LEHLSNFQQFDTLQLEPRGAPLNTAFIIIVKEKRKKGKDKQ
jgi:hypothetical protein